MSKTPEGLTAKITAEVAYYPYPLPDIPDDYEFLSFDCPSEDEEYMSAENRLSKGPLKVPRVIVRRKLPTPGLGEDALSVTHKAWAAEVRKLRDERDKLRDQLRDVLAQMQPEPEQVKPKPRFVVEFAADVMTGLTTPANLENPGLVTIIHEFKPITPDKLVFLRDVFYEACGGNLDTRGIEGITAVLRKLGYECL